jgi:hypothetical protein
MGLTAIGVFQVIFFFVVVVDLGVVFELKCAF